jgi:hypothetical protein
VCVGDDAQLVATDEHSVWEEVLGLSTDRLRLPAQSLSCFWTLSFSVLETWVLIVAPTKDRAARSQIDRRQCR